MRLENWEQTGSRLAAEETSDYTKKNCVNGVAKSNISDYVANINESGKLE